MNRPTNSRVTPRSAAWLLMAVTILVFCRIVFNDWVEFDDTINVTENPRYFPLTWAGVAAFWTAPFLELYIPVSYMLFGAECWLSRALAGDGPTAPLHAGVFHAVSLALHVGVVLLVGKILSRFVNHPVAVLAGAALFAWHPLQVESVAWVSEQRGLLAALFSLAALDGLIVAGDRGAAARGPGLAYVMATLAFAAALLSKPVAIMTPLIGVALLQHRERVSRGVILKLVGPWLVMAAAAALVTRWVQPASLCDFHTPPAARLLVAGDALGFYAGKVLVPRDLCVGYGRTPQYVLANPWSPAVASVVALAFVAVFTVPRLRPCRLPAALFVIPLVPVLGFTDFLFQNQSTVADRYAYLALLGPALGLAWLAAHLITNGREGRVLRFALASALGVLALTAWRQTATWVNTGALAAHACSVAPAVTGSWTMLAGHWLQAGDPRRSIECAEHALRIAPNNDTVLYSVAEAYARLGDTEAMRGTLRRLDAFGTPAAAVTEGFYTRGVSYLKAGRTVEAIIDFGIALEASPTHPATLVNLGVAYSRLGQHDEAIKVLRAAVEVDPRQPAGWIGLGNALLKEGKATEARDCYDRALTIVPEDGGTLINRAWARLEAGDVTGAASDASQAGRLGMAVDPTLIDTLTRARAGR